MLMNENKLILLEYVPYYAILIGKCRVQLNNKLHTCTFKTCPHLLEIPSIK